LLKLKKVQILGFKSFCDRTEVQLSGEGIAAIVGPNGCGKSNISDAITWVLGEQSAKSLRGIKMEDVIFAGTRDRKPTGMAEVSLTLVDPEVYDGASLNAEPEIVIDDNLPADWDETSLRQQSAADTEEAVAEAQPGTIIEGEAKAAPTEADASAAEAANPNNVVLKIRRRKFGRAPIRAGELTITRRLFRSGDSATSRTSLWALGSAANPTPSSARSVSASFSAPNPSTAAASSKRPPASPALRPKSASPNSASSPPARTSPASTTSSTKSPAR
jgi:chromosome segregation protein